MKLPPHAMALDLHLFESMVQRSAGMGSLPELISEFAPYIGKRDLTLDCPREEILVNPPPSYIFVMNEDLCGVYPAPTGVYIRKPLERGEEVMVLQPGFQGTKALYYYHNNKSQLFVLCEDNRKLIIHELRASSEPISSSVEVLGLPDLSDSYDDDEDTQMVCTDDFVFVLFGTEHLFCIDRLRVENWAQAKLIRFSRCGYLDLAQLLVDPQKPQSVQLLTSSCGSSWSLLTLNLESRQKPLYFKETITAVLPQTAGDDESHIHNVLPVDHHAFAVIHSDLVQGSVLLTLCDRQLHALGPASVLFDTPENCYKQFTYGKDGIIYMYSMRKPSRFVRSHQEYEVPDYVMDDLWRTSSMLNRRERRPGVNMDVDTLRVENMTWRMRNKWKNHVPSEIDYEDDASPDTAGVDESCKGLLDVIKDHNEDIEVETSRILAGAPFASTSLSSVFRHDHYHGFLLDMDGVLHQFGKAIPGASEFMTTLNAGQVPYMLLTNECRYTTEELSRNLLSILGVSIPANQIYTAANSAADFFCRLMANGWTGVVYIVGEVGLISTVRQAFVKHGLPEDSVVTGDTRRSRSPKEIDYVLIGSVHSDNTRYVEYACSCVQEGARLLFTCPDYYEVTSDGSYKFGMPMPAVETISKVTHASSYNLGKPNPHMLRMARQRLLSQCSRGRTPGLGPVLFVGDSLGTDIRTAIENGIDCAL
ncbi:hypothetical protein FOZ62_025775, partial [Perkinsus olseni]